MLSAAPGVPPSPPSLPGGLPDVVPHSRPQAVRYFGDGKPHGPSGSWSLLGGGGLAHLPAAPKLRVPGHREGSRYVRLGGQGHFPSREGSRRVPACPDSLMRTANPMFQATRDGGSPRPQTKGTYLLFLPNRKGPPCCPTTPPPSWGLVPPPRQEDLLAPLNGRKNVVLPTGKPPPRSQPCSQRGAPTTLSAALRGGPSCASPTPSASWLRK